MKSIRSLIIISFIFVVLAAGSTFAFASVASESETAAKDLFQYGLLQGKDEVSLGLNQPCTKMECCVMAVRLLGAEEYVRKDYADAECIFADVEKWAKPYVVYLMEQGIITGNKSGNFGSDDVSDADTYALMLLRIMGYPGSAKETALNTAAGLNMFTEAEVQELRTGSFNRASLVFMTWRALDMPVAPDADETFKGVLDASGLLEDNAVEEMPFLEAEEPEPEVEPVKTVTTSGLGEKTVAEGKKYMGVRYRSSGRSPSTGFDCSGYVNYVLMKSGVHSQWYASCVGLLAHSTSISASEAKPGDLVFFSGTYSTSRKVTHVGIYLGNGQMIHASSSKGVSIAGVHDAYWGKHFYGFARP